MCAGGVVLGNTLYGNAVTLSSSVYEEMSLHFSVRACLGMADVISFPEL